MTADIEKKQLKELRDIAGDLEVLRESTHPKNAFLRGLIQGAGAVIGGVLALSLLGWILSLLGFIPGFDSFEQSLQGVVNSYEHR